MRRTAAFESLEKGIRLCPDCAECLQCCRGMFEMRFVLVSAPESYKMGMVIGAVLSTLMQTAVSLINACLADIAKMSRIDDTGGPVSDELLALGWTMLSKVLPLRVTADACASSLLDENCCS